jgi:hypothetical protein
MGFLEAAVEGVKEFTRAMYPGLSLDKILSDVVAEGKQLAAHGAHEIAAALFSTTGSAFVMYPRGTREDQPKREEEDRQKEQNEPDRGREMNRGMEM